MSSDGQTVRLIDFGSAKRTDSKGEFEWDSVQPPDPYGAPERVHCCEAVDAFAFGLVLMQLIEPAKAAAALSNEPDDARPVPPSVDDPVLGPRRVETALKPVASSPIAALTGQSAAEALVVRRARSFARLCRSSDPADRPGGRAVPRASAMAAAVALLSGAIEAVACDEALRLLSASTSAARAAVSAAALQSQTVPMETIAEYLMPPLSGLSG